MNERSAQLRAEIEDPATQPGKTKPKPTAGPPSLRRGRSHSGTEGFTADAAQLASDYEQVRHRYEDVLRENETLKGEQKRRMESYMRRQENYESEIADLKAELERQRQEKPPQDSRMTELKVAHRKNLDVIGAMQSREQLSLQEQEKDLLRAFRARLWDVQFELESERSKKDDGALEWIEKTKTLGKELDWSRDEALRLDRSNQFLTKENERLKTQLRAQSDDREFIVRQMLTLKKENARLKVTIASAAEAEAEVAPAAAGRAQSASIRRGAAAAPGGAARPNTAGASAFRSVDESSEALDGEGGPGGSMAASERIKELMLQQAESEERYREVVARLKRLLDVERRNLKAVRAAHAKELQSRSELESLLRACVDDVRKELAAQRAGAAASSPAKPAGGAAVGVEELGPKERERVLELLLSQERVVSLLYERTFPPPAHPAADSTVADDLAAGAAEEEDDDDDDDIVG